MTHRDSLMKQQLTELASAGEPAFPDLPSDRVEYCCMEATGVYDQTLENARTVLLAMVIEKANCSVPSSG